MRICFVFSSGRLSLTDLDEAPPVLEVGVAVQDEHGNYYDSGNRMVLERLPAYETIDPVDGIVIYEQVTR